MHHPHMLYADTQSRWQERSWRSETQAGGENFRLRQNINHVYHEKEKCRNKKLLLSLFHNLWFTVCSSIKYETFLLLFVSLQCFFQFFSFCFFLFCFWRVVVMGGGMCCDTNSISLIRVGERSDKNTSTTVHFQSCKAQPSEGERKRESVQLSICSFFLSKVFVSGTFSAFHFKHDIT